MYEYTIKADNQPITIQYGKYLRSTKGIESKVRALCSFVPDCEKLLKAHDKIILSYITDLFKIFAEADELTPLKVEDECKQIVAKTKREKNALIAAVSVEVSGTHIKDKIIYGINAVSDNGRKTPLMAFEKGLTATSREGKDFDVGREIEKSCVFDLLGIVGYEPTNEIDFSFCLNGSKLTQAKEMLIKVYDSRITEEPYGRSNEIAEFVRNTYNVLKRYDIEFAPKPIDGRPRKTWLYTIWRYILHFGGGTENDKSFLDFCKQYNR